MEEEVTINEETERAREEAALKVLRAEAAEIRIRAANLNSEVLISISQSSQGKEVIQ